jgi:hypothetical protein
MKDLNLNNRLIMKKENLVTINLLVMLTLGLIIFGNSCKTNINYSVDPKTSPDIILTEVCDTITKQWSKNDNQQYIKNVNSKDSIRNDFYWNSESNVWINYQKVAYGYDNKGHEISQTYSIFDNNTNQWILSSKSEVTYNSEGKRISDTYSTWQSLSKNWVTSVKTIVTYDENGNDTLETMYIWDANLKNWVVSCKLENKYNANGNKILRIDYKLDQGSGIWEFLCKYEYTYAINNKLLSQKYFYWNPKSRTFENYSIDKYEYANNLISHHYHYQWIFSYKSWFIDNRSTYYYHNTRKA